MTYVLHYAPDNASLIVRLALEELGQPYRTVLVDRSRAGQHSAAFRALNPAGLIPVLETPDGPLFETAAILLWLADRHGAMAPAPGAPGRGDFLKWLFFTSNTVHAQLRMLFYPEKYLGEDRSAQENLVRTLTRRSTAHMTLPDALDLLDARMVVRGDAPPEVLDYYIAALLRWCALYPVGGTAWFDLNEYPGLLILAQNLQRRPAVKAAQAAEGLGPTPFTAPVFANPIEGSAT
jgi:glutathione S-transferase